MDNRFSRMTSQFDRKDKRLQETENNQRLAGLQHQAQQPRLATEAVVKPDTKTHERTEGTEADEEKYGYAFAARVDDNLTILTSFGNTAEPLAPKKASVTLWPTKALKHQSRILHPWRCAY